MKNYEKYMNKEYMMGPSCLHLANELIQNAPDALQGRVLDLGCGRALTSYFTAKESRADVVYAMDLWTSATDNWQRIRDWGMEDKMIPIHADANQMPFAEEFFDGLISVDAYHYFGRGKGYFQKNVLPFLKKGGRALIAVPGLKAEFDGNPPEDMVEWAGDEWTYFHSCAWWKELLEAGFEDQVEVNIYPAACCDQAWQVWFDSGHEYALNDQKYMERSLKQHMNFVMMDIRKK